MAKFSVAHIRSNGVDLILFPVSPEITGLSPTDQATVLKQAQSICRSAGLAGETIPVWQTATGVKFFAHERFHQILRGHLTPEFLKANLNKEINAPQITGNLARLLGDVASHGIGMSSALQSAPPQAAATSAGAGAAASQSSSLPSIFGRARGDYPIRVVTLLFTDVVGSTKLKQVHGDTRALEVMNLHHAMVRRLLAQSATGEEVSTSGDSFFLVFGTPSEAVTFALQVQANLRDIDQTDGVRIQDRIGIHCGEVYADAAKVAGKTFDFNGINVDTAARVQSLATADQILMTRFAFDNAHLTLKGHEIPDVGHLTWRNYGLYEVKGVSQPIEICEVGETGRANLKAPPDAEKAHRVVEKR
jgi:class 3 adenylate cyclase